MAYGYMYKEQKPNYDEEFDEYYCTMLITHIIDPTLSDSHNKTVNAEEVREWQAACIMPCTTKEQDELLAIGLHLEELAVQKELNISAPISLLDVPVCFTFISLKICAFFKHSYIFRNLNLRASVKR